MISKNLYYTLVDFLVKAVCSPSLRLSLDLLKCKYSLYMIPFLSLMFSDSLYRKPCPSSSLHSTFRNELNSPFLNGRRNIPDKLMGPRNCRYR